jgi:hypothetical protein
MAKIKHTIQRTEFLDIELEEEEIIRLAVRVIEKKYDLPLQSYIEGKYIYHVVLDGIFPHIEKYRKVNKLDKVLYKLMDDLYKIGSLK